MGAFLLAIYAQRKKKRGKKKNHSNPKYLFLVLDAAQLRVNDEYHTIIARKRKADLFGAALDLKFKSKDDEEKRKKKKKQE